MRFLASRDLCRNRAQQQRPQNLDAKGTSPDGWIQGITRKYQKKNGGAQYNKPRRRGSERLGKRSSERNFWVFCWLLIRRQREAEVK